MIHASDRTVPPYTDKPSQHRDSLAAKPRLSRIGHLRGVTGATLARIGALPYDSRDSLPSKEQQLAELGISWATDAAYDAQLAQELADSRLRRHDRMSTGLPAHQTAATSAVSGRRFRWSVGMLLIRAGRCLQSGQPVKANV